MFLRKSLIPARLIRPNLTKTARRRVRRRRTGPSAALCRVESHHVGRFVETLEDRTLLSGHTIEITLDPVLDQFGFQPVTVQALDDANTAEVENWVGFSIFDTGASVVTLSALENELFFTPMVPIKVPGGAVAQGIGGLLTGDVSHPLTTTVDGLNATSLTFDADGFPIFEINFTPQSISVPGVQVFVGTLEGSPSLPSISGTPMLNPTAENPNGSAVVIEPEGELLDFSDLIPGLILPVPAVFFQEPGTDLTAGEFTVSFGSVDDTVTPGAAQFAGSETLYPFDDIFTGFTVRFTSGELTGEQRQISDYDGDTRILTFAEPFSAAPAVGDEFEIVRFSTDPVEIDLELIGFDNSANPGDEITVSPNPVHNGIRLSHEGVVLENQNFLFDTGAMLSTITTEQALALGLDLSSPDDRIAVGGASGTVTDVPGFLIEEFAVPTAEGGEVSFQNVWVYVLDVAEEIDGIWGMNLFNASARFQYDPFDPDGTPSLQMTFFEDRVNLPPPDDPDALALLAGLPFAGAVGLSGP